MLYYLFRFLEQFGISGAHIWGYISFRSLLAMILSLVISAWFGEKFIRFLKRKQITEVQRDKGIDPFGVNKIGVPSMGGIIIIVAILVPVLLLGRLRNVYLLLMIATTVWLGFLGGMDDFIKIFRHNKEGLKGKYTSPSNAKIAPRWWSNTGVRLANRSRPPSLSSRDITWITRASPPLWAPIKGRPDGFSL